MSTEPLVQPLTYTETCRICGKKFTGAPLQSPSDPRMQKLGEALFKHMFSTDETHKNFAVICILMAGYLIEDPVAMQYGAGIRYMMFRSLRKNFVPDEKIHDIVSRIPPEEFEAAMQDMRDFLTEDGPHCPIQMEPAKTVN